MMNMQPNVTQSSFLKSHILQNGALQPGTLQPSTSLQPNAVQAGTTLQQSTVQASTTLQPNTVQAGNTLQQSTVQAGTTLQQSTVQPGTVQPRTMLSGLMQPNTLQQNPLVCPIKVMTASICYNCIMKVGGKGIVKAEPDKASVVLGVVTENMQLEIAQNENAQKMSNVIDSLIRNGIPKEDIKTQSYQIQPQYDFVNGEQLFRGYRVINEVRAEIKNTNLVGRIIDEAVGAGANTVNDISFHVSKPQKYYEMAINQALSDAVSKAISIGAKMTVYVNPVPLKIKEITTPVTAPIPYMSMQATGAVTPIQPGMNEITAILEVEFVYSCNRHY